MSIISQLLHVKCRNTAYPRSDGVERVNVPDNLVNWSVAWPEYKPVCFTASYVYTAEWADPDPGSTGLSGSIANGAIKPLNAACFDLIGDLREKKGNPARIESSHPDAFAKIHFNTIDGKIDRKSFTGTYTIDGNSKLPLNPFGRTGLAERGSLGRWGPNHAADPIVTRWKIDSNGQPVIDQSSQRRILQFVAIERKDCGEWAIPGGMVDAGEQCSETLKREFAEEALNSIEASSEAKEKMMQSISSLFKSGVEIYNGYVDDPRNTDNAWMETTAMNFHDETGDGLGKFNLVAGDDARKVHWMDISSSLNLYASHKHFIELVAKKRNANW